MGKEEENLAEKEKQQRNKTKQIMQKTKEIKPTFTIKYISFFIFLTIISSIVGYFINDQFNKKTNTLTISKYISGNLVNIYTIDDNPIEIEYSLKNNPKTKIESYFISTFYLKNTGKNSAENLKVTISLNEPNVYFVDNPIIKSLPENILSGIKIQNIEKTENKHVWNIDLLNKNEELIFQYIIYSEEKKQTINVDVTPRKKDWGVVYKDTSISSGLRPTFYSLITLQALALLILLFPVILWRYKIRWDSDEELRKKYNKHFWKYFISN